MMIVSLQQLEQLLKDYPIIVQGKRLLLGCITDLEIIRDYEAFEKILDRLDHNEINKIAIIDDKASQGKFPVVSLQGVIDTVKLSEYIFCNRNTFNNLLTKQSEVGTLITRFADKDVIVLVIVDGMSYFDCCKYSNVEPCFVDGVTLTREGFLSIVGKPNIAEKLFDLGFFDLRGYTYWTRDEDSSITNEIFDCFPPTSFFKMKEFEDALEDLSQQKLFKTFVQIVMNGLDHLCHSGRDRPIVSAYVQRTFDRLRHIEDVIKDKKRSGVVIMTADHGIIWNLDELQVVNDYFFKEASGVRWTSGTILRDYIWNVNVGGRNYSILKYPYITRRIRSNEWGVHGGISAWESLTPLYIKEV